MNNKGFTVVELIITFVIVMTISLGLFSTVDSYRERQQKEMYRKEVMSYRNEVLKAIENDVTRYNFKSYQKIDVTAAGSVCAGYEQGIQIKFAPIAGDSDIDKNLCFGNNVESNKAGILYGDVKYIAPTKFIKFEQDIIDNVTKNVDSKIPMVIFSGIDPSKEVFSKNTTNGLSTISASSASLDVYTIVKNIYSFTIRIKHEEIKSEFNLNVTFTKPVGEKLNTDISGVSINGIHITLPATYTSAQLTYIKQAFINNGFVIGTDVVIS